MGGEVIVKPRGATIPTAKQDAATLAKEEAGYVREAKRVLKHRVPAREVSLGLSGPGGLEVFGMFPARLTIKAGTTVRFFMSKDSRETHTASFGPLKYLRALSDSFRGPAPDPRAVYPSDPPGRIALTPRSHGNGFASTGALDRDAGTPTIPAFGAITFSTPGKYNFVCLIHPFMRGQIVVTK
jgi:plastocyanin